MLAPGGCRGGGLGELVHFHASPERQRRLVVPGVDDAAADVFACAAVSQVHFSAVRHKHIRFGAVSSVYYVLVSTVLVSLPQ